MNIEANISCCAVCEADQPRPCVFTDWISEHTHPYGRAITSLEIQQAVRKVDWNPESLRAIAQISLVESGEYTETGIQRILEDNYLNNWVVQKGINEAVKQQKIRYTPGGSVHGLLDRLDTDGEERTYYVCCFYLPCPDPAKWAIMPVLIEYVNFHEKWQEFMKSEFDEYTLVLGSSDQWMQEWQDWWKSNGVTQKQWESNHRQYWRALNQRGESPESQVGQFMEAVQQQMVLIVKNRLAAWRENQK